ncbi:hypothetical protein JJQ72_18535 [Paenibacillus sp. F411]|uniref:hypothetical protein n=1 Tax=Paenibacillus sp. F411 TaxID=2820239 RepID=UPI001AAF6A8A|nr:hypothetical protein [Paenibacillus sp. F411]
MIAALIVGCEIGFWVLVVAGLCARYLFGRKKLGALLLAATPVVDLLLITVTVLDLKNGAEAKWVHGLAAVYIGVTIAFGRSMISWADQRFAYRFAGGSKPLPRARTGREHARLEREGWLRHLLSWCIGCVILAGMVWYVGEPANTEVLIRMVQVWSAVLGIDFIISFSYTLWPKGGVRR